MAEYIFVLIVTVSIEIAPMPCFLQVCATSFIILIQAIDGILPIMLPVFWDCDMYFIQIFCHVWLTVCLCDMNVSESSILFSARTPWSCQNSSAVNGHPGPLRICLRRSWDIEKAVGKGEETVWGNVSTEKHERFKIFCNHKLLLSVNCITPQMSIRNIFIPITPFTSQHHWDGGFS